MCTELLPVTVKQYEAVREDPRRFLCASRTRGPREVDRVVERHRDWLVVEKLAGASEIAVDHDPRS